MSERSTRRWGWMLGVGLLLSACGSSAQNRKIEDARQGYGEAQSARASQHAPAQMRAATEALAAAARAEAEGPGSARARHLAYVAWQRSRAAAEAGRAGQLDTQKDSAIAEKSHLQRTLREQAERDLRDTQAALDRLQSTLSGLKKSTARCAASSPSPA